MANNRPSAALEIPTPMPLQFPSSTPGSSFDQYSTKPAPVCGPRSLRLPCNFPTIPNPDRSRNSFELLPGSIIEPAAPSLSPRASPASIGENGSAGIPALRRASFNAAPNICSVDVVATSRIMGARFGFFSALPAQPINVIGTAATQQARNFAFIRTGRAGKKKFQPLVARCVAAASRRRSLRNGEMSFVRVALRRDAQPRISTHFTPGGGVSTLGSIFGSMGTRRRTSLVRAVTRNETVISSAVIRMTDLSAGSSDHLPGLS